MSNNMDNKFIYIIDNLVGWSFAVVKGFWALWDNIYECVGCY
jgi:hypothetical protein